MSVDVQNESQTSGDTQKPQSEQPARPSFSERFRESFSNVQWVTTLVLALVMAAGWCFLFLSFSWLQILAGLVPVSAGLYLGRRVKKHLLTHGLILGVSGFVIGLVIVGAYGLLGDAGIIPLPQATSPDDELITLSGNELILYYFSFSTIALIPFPAFGAVMAGRSEERRREMQRQVDERGGRLERPQPVRSLEDLQGLSLPQLGSYVRTLYEKQGFRFQDYRFDRGKYLDIEMVHTDEIYLLRLSVADRVNSGTVETLAQEMKKRSIPKGVVITSTIFSPDAVKSGKGRRNMVLIDGETLYEIA